MQIVEIITTRLHGGDPAQFTPLMEEEDEEGGFILHLHVLHVSPFVCFLLPRSSPRLIVYPRRKSSSARRYPEPIRRASLGGSAWDFTRERRRGRPDVGVAVAAITDKSLKRRGFILAI